MPSQKPRIALTIPDDLNSLLDRLSVLTGTPKTRLIVEVLEQTKPVFETMLAALEQISQSKENAPELLRKFAQDVILDSQEQLGIIASEARKL